MGGIGANANTPKAKKMPEAITVTKDKVTELQQIMEQSGYEAGDAETNPSNKLYVNSGKSFNINKFLNTDGDTIVSNHTDWSNYIDKPWVKGAIQKIDAGMRPLPESVKTTRYLDGDSLAYMTDGITGNFSKFMELLDAGKIKGSDFTKILQNVDYTHKGYTSTTYEPKHGSYDNRDIRLNMVLQKGTPAIITNNHKKHEILAGRNQKYNFTGGWSIETTPSGKKQLVLDVYI